MNDISIITKYFPRLSEEQKEQFSKLKDLYELWNAQINVISRKEIDLLYERHVLHSLAIAKYISFKPGTAILDVGTGGGFPGIPLAIMFPESEFLLVDSVGKKIKVVNEVVAGLGLTNVRTANIRAEEIKEWFDFVISRAVTDFDEFYHWVKRKFNQEGFNPLRNGIIYLKGGDLKEELKKYQTKVKVTELTKYFSEEFYQTKKLVYMPC